MRVEPSRTPFLLGENRVDAFLVTRGENVRYLSGFTGSTAILLLTPHADHFLTDSRYTLQAEREVSGFRIHVAGRNEDLPGLACRLLEKRKTRRVGFEAGHMSVQVHRGLKKRLRASRLVPARKGVELLRMVKSDREVAKIMEAVKRAEAAFRAVRPRIRPGRSEQEIALSMEGVMRRRGAARTAFDLIVASGRRSAMPHGIASTKRLKKGDLVILDFGAECDGYYSDMTRTLYLGERLIGRKRKIHDLVREAQAAAIAAVRPGVRFGEIDAAAREIINRAGFGPFFGHGTGHGIGLEVHELPRVGPGNPLRLVPGMVFTIEPGVYLPGLGGVRIEDMVLVTHGGCRVLTRLSKEWAAGRD